MTTSPDDLVIELKRIKMTGFRSLRDVELEPGRITVLIGANGAGKTNLLAALRMLPLMRTQSLRRFVAGSGGASTLLHYGPKVTPELTLRLEFAQGTGTNAYTARLGHTAGDALVYNDEIVESHPNPNQPAIHQSLGVGHGESLISDNVNSLMKMGAFKTGLGNLPLPADPDTRNAIADAIQRVHRGIARMSFFHFHDTSSTSPLRQNSRQSEDQYLRSDGSNLATYLFRLANSDAPDDVAAWKRVGMLLRRVAPYIKRIDPALVDLAHPDRSAIRIGWIDENDHRFDVSDLSDGTLRALALITALSQPVARLPRFLSIDEPELGLHPAAITLLAGLVRSIAPRCQVLLATQSPALLDHFEPEEVVVAERANGETSFRRLDREALATWLEEYSLSELFDKNVLGGRP